MSPFGWLVEALLASALLMAAVLILRAPVRRLFGPQVAYGLWALPLLRLMLPPLPAWWYGATLPSRASKALAVLIVEAPAGRITAQATPASWPTMVAALPVVWAVGVVLFLCHHVLAHRRFCGVVERSAVAADRIEGVRLLTSTAASGPLAFGLRRPTVVLPVDMAHRYDPDEQALALAHEIAHHRRGDLYANWIALGVLALHWFDPLAWFAFRAFRADQELATDAQVVADRPASELHLYARAIVKAAQGGSLSPACHLHTVADLKGRLKMLATSTKSRRRLASGAISVIAFAIAGLGLTASATSAAAIGRHVERAVASGATPTPAPSPAPPTAPAQAAAAPDGQVRRVLVVRNGKSTVYDRADIDAHLAAGDTVAIQPLAPGSSRMIMKVADDPATRIEVQDVPAVASAKCGIGTGEPTSMVIQSGRGAKRKIVICTDRIRMVTASALATEANARTVEHDAYAQALAGLTDARARAVTDARMSDIDRTRALAGIDQAITEMSSQLARGR